MLASTLAAGCPQNLANGLETPAAAKQLVTVEAKVARTHAQTGGPTIGCISLRKSELRAVLRWLNPAEGPMIAIGMRSQLCS